MSCVLLDTKEQFISRTRLGDENLVAVEHEKWYVKIPVKEVNQFKASNTLSKILSPFSYLYLKYRQSGKQSRLYIAILEDHIYLVTFADDIALYYKIYGIDQKPLVEIIKEFLHDFYSQENSFFVEGIEIYRLNLGYTVLDHELQEELLLPVEVHDEDLGKICTNSEFSKYFVSQTSKEGRSFIVKSRFVLAVGLSIVGLLIAYDIFLRFQNNSLEERLKSLVQKQVELGNENNEIKTRLMTLQKVRPVLEHIKEQNALVYEKIKNIFDLVPDRTYLTKAEFDKGAVILEGVTKDKKEVQNILDAELSRNFQKRRLRFERSADGYRFRAVYEEVVGDAGRS